MANKLFGTADPTLVRASFMHGASNIPKDLSAVYKQREANVKDFATGINEVFDKIYADDKATGDLLADVADKSLKLMETGGVVNEYELTQHNEIVNGYKQRHKDITREYGMGKGGDLERSKLRSEMNTYLAASEKDGATLIELTKAANNNVLLSDVGDNKKELLTLIIQDENNGTNLTKPEYIKGEKYYSLPGTDVKMTMTELAEGFSIRDPKLLSNINKKLTNFVAKGKASGKAMTEDDALRFKNEIQGSMSSWDEIRNVGQEKFGNMKFTFEEVLTGRATGADGNIDTDLIGYVYDELEKLGGADLDNDGDIDETDKSLLAKAKAEGKLYTDAKNGHTLIDAIKKDKQLYRDVMANYLTETAVRDSYGQGLDQFKPKGGTSNGGGGDTDKGGKYGGWKQTRVKTGGGGDSPKSITWQTATQRRSYLDAFDQVDGEHANYDPVFDNKNNFLHYLRRDDGKQMSMFDVARDEGLVKPGENKGSFNPGKIQKSNTEYEYTSKGLAAPSMLQEVKGDDAASLKLNNNFNFDSNSDFYFTPYSRDIATAGGGDGDWFSRSMSDNIFSNDIMLIDNRGDVPKPVYISGQTAKGNVKVKDIRRFSTKGDYDKSDLDWINNFLADYVDKSDPSINTEFED